MALVSGPAVANNGRRELKMQTGISTSQRCGRRAGLLAVLLATAVSLSVRPTLAGEAGNEGLTLDELIGSSLTVGDKTFYFDCYFSCDISAASITVTPINEGMDAIGFELSGSCPTGGWGWDWWDRSGFILKYHVVVDDPNNLIKDAALGLRLEQDTEPTIATSSYWDNDDGCSARVTETLKAGLVTPNLSAFVDENNPEDGDQVEFDPVRCVYVVKKFSLSGCGGWDWSANCGDYDRDSCQFSIVQTFSQIPEPSAVVLVMLGCCGLVPLMRRRG